MIGFSRQGAENPPNPMADFSEFERRERLILFFTVCVPPAAAFYAFLRLDASAHSLLLPIVVPVFLGLTIAMLSNNPRRSTVVVCALSFLYIFAVTFWRPARDSNGGSWIFFVPLLLGYLAGLGITIQGVRSIVGVIV